MGVETMIWERGRFLHETLEEMEKVLKTLQPDVVAVEAFSENVSSEFLVDMFTQWRSQT